MSRTDYPLYGKPGTHVISYINWADARVITWAGVSHHKAAAAWARTVEEHKHAEAEVWHGDDRTWGAIIERHDSASKVWEVKP